MLLKIGNTIINRDHVVYAVYDEADQPPLRVFLLNVHSGSVRRSTVLDFDGDEAKAVWMSLSGDAKDLIKNASGAKQINFRI